MDDSNFKENSLDKSYYNSDSGSFFTAKKTMFILAWTIISIVLIGLTFKFVLDINFVEIFNLIANSHSKDNRYFWLWFVLLVLFPIYNCFLRVFAFSYKLHKKKIFIRWYEWINFALITFFVSGITPFSTGAEPYIIYWLKKRGLSYKEASALVVSFSVINPIVQIIVTWPSFFFLCSEYNYNSDNATWLTCFWSVFVGLMFDLMATADWIILGYSKNAHYIINLVVNKFKKTLKMKYKTKEEIRVEYKENQEFKKTFINELKDFKFVISLSCLSLFWNIYYYCSFIFAFNLLDPNFSFNAFELFNYVNVSTTANNFIPIPGTEGTLQAVIINFIKNSKQFTDIPNLDKLVPGATYVWRSATFYITTLLGGLVFVGMLLQLGKYSLVRKIKIRKSIPLNKSFTFIIKNVDDVDSLLVTLNSIRWCEYNQKYIDIVVAVKSVKNLRAKIDQVFWFDPKIILVSDYDSNLTLLNKIKEQIEIPNDYISIIESGEQITYETLKYINQGLEFNDIYLGAFRRTRGKQISPKKSPYPYFFSRKIKSKNRMSTIKADFSAIYFKKNILDNLNDKYLISQDDIGVYNLLIQNAKNIKFENKIFVFKEFKKKNKWNLNTIISLVENGNKNLAIQILLTKRRVMSEFKKSHYRFETNRWAILPSFNIFRKIRLQAKYQFRIKKKINYKK